MCPPPVRPAQAPKSICLLLIGKSRLVRILHCRFLQIFINVFGGNSFFLSVSSQFTEKRDPSQADHKLYYNRKKTSMKAVRQKVLSFLKKKTSSKTGVPSSAAPDCLRGVRKRRRVSQRLRRSVLEKSDKRKEQIVLYLIQTFLIPTRERTRK